MNTETNTQPAERVCSGEDLVDRAAYAIKRCKRNIVGAYAATEELRERLEAASDSLAMLAPTDDSKDLIAIRLRIDRIQELRRMMECGSLVIRVNQAMQDAWERLP